MRAKGTRVAPSHGGPSAHLRRTNAAERPDRSAGVTEVPRLGRTESGMFRTSILLAWSIAAAAAAQTSPTQPTSAPSDTLEKALAYVPDDTNLIVIIPSIKGLTTAVTEYGKTLGAADLAERILVGEIEFDVGGNRLTFSGATIDAQGPLVVAMSAQRDEPLLIARADRPEQWKATSRSARPDGVPVYELGGRCYAAATAEDLAIFARDPADLPQALKARASGPGRLARAACAALGDRQVLIYVDVPGWNDLVQTRLTTLTQVMLMGMTATTTAAGDADTAVQLWNWLFDRLRRAVGDTETLALGLRVTAADAYAEIRVALKPGSETARHLGQVRRPGRDPFRGLPPRTGSMVIAYEWEEPPGSETLSNSLLRSLLGVESLRERVGAERLETVVKLSTELNRFMTGSNIVIDFSADGGGFLSWGLYLTDDGPAMQRAFRDLCEKAPDLYSTWGSIPATIEARAHEQIAGVATDVYRFNFSEAEAAMQPVMQAIYGPDPTLYLAPHSAGVVYAFGPAAPARERMVELLGGGGLSREPRVAAALKRLSPDPQLSALVDFPAAVRGMLTMVQQMGVPVPRLPTAADSPAPLVGLNLYLEPQTIRAELIVPAEAIKSLIKAAEALKSPGLSAY